MVFTIRWQSGIWAAIRNPEGGVPREDPPGGIPRLDSILPPLPKYHLSNSPSLNVALWEVGFTFLGFFMLSNSPSLNVALREVGLTFFGEV